LTSPKKTAHGATTDDIHDYLVSVSRELGINVSDETKEYNKSKEATTMEWMSYREQDPFNEFLGGASGRKDEGMVKAFPDVFFLGKGYNSNRPSLNEEQVEHLLMQFTTNAATCRPLLFYLFDQLQRHGSIKGMHAKRTNKENEFAKFTEEFMSESFQEMLKEAVKYPHGKIGKKVLKKIEPILTGGGKRTTFGALARADTGGKIMAMRRRYGCAPAFLTFAIDDVNHPTSMRMAMSSSSNTDFPAAVSGGHHEAMKHGFKYNCGEGNVSIPASYSARLRALVENPVGAACVYKELVIDVLSILVGKAPGSGHKRGTTRTSTLASWDEEKLGAINGTSLAYLGVNETTGGGSLHLHVVSWGGLSPDILELGSDLPKVCEHVGSVLDSIYRATLPREVHVRDLVTKDLKQNCDSSPAFKRRDAAAGAMLVPPDPAERRDEFQAFTDCTVCGRNIHEHSHTCYKPPNGYHGCRMHRPAGDSDGTKPIQLSWSEEKQEAVEEDIEAAGPISDDPKYDFSPLTSPDNRTLLWELDRPKLEGLPALDCGLDEEMARADIISKLSESMWGKTDSRSQRSYIVECVDAFEKECYSSEEIDVHTFFNDQHRLFHGMLKGLVTAGVSLAYETSVEDLRKELMDWLKAHPNEKFKGKALDEHRSTQSGGELELFLLSKAKRLNVRLYTKDVALGHFVFEDAFEACEDVANAPTLHFVKKSDDDCYSFFVPKTEAITRELQSLGLKQLIGLYDRVAKKLEDRNGWVVEYNPLLTSLLGCNTNLGFLGSKEQSKQALFYIGPYINKNGVKIVDALPLLAHAQNHALQYPSSADDADANPRLVQYIVTRVLNKLNSMMEISDTQAALALLGMGPTVCSDIFSYYDLRSTKNFVLDEYCGKFSSLADINIVLDGAEDAVSLGDDDSFSSVPSDDDEDDVYDRCGETDADVLSGADPEYDSFLDDASESENEDVGWKEGFFGGEHDNLPDDEIESKNEDNEHGMFFFDEESSDDETVAEPVQFNDSPIAVPVNYVTGEYGPGKLIKTYSPEGLFSVPYPVLYRYRGEALKDLNRLEYYSLVQVKRRIKKESDGKRDGGRTKAREFPFGQGLNEVIGGDGNGRWYQYMRSKQCTPQFFSSPARHPGGKPSDPEQQMAWRMAADKFACDFLIMFRPEPDLCKHGQCCSYEYNWEAFEEFVLELQTSDNAIDCSRLELIERMVHSWGVDETKKQALSWWRGRSRTLWSAEDKQLANAEYAKFKRSKFDDGDDNDVVCGCYGGPSEQLTLRQTNDARKMISHSAHLMTELNRLHGGPSGSEQATGPFEPVRTIKFDEQFAASLPKLQPRDESDDGDCIIGSDVHGSVEAKVNAYLKDEDLSTDKSPVIDVMLEHFRAFREGRAQERSYEAPLLLVRGGPGNGKSKLVETLDGVASLMYAGTQVKTAFLGVAAVNIGGSTLCSLLDIPTERRNREGGLDIKKVILPWSDAKKRKFIKRYDINRISCIVVDEISTLQPYMLAYLSARLMELFPESGKDFGGIAIILCGDFDQLPPVGGDNLAAAVMKHEELQGSTGNGEITRWDRRKHCVNVHKEGLRLFQKSVCFELTQQHRSKDPTHTGIIENMRRSGKVSMFDLKRKCKLLEKEDVVGDGEFRFATTLVTGNEERHKINNLKAKDWASHHGSFLIRWHRDVSYRGWKGRPRSKEHIKQAMSQNEIFYELFVQGARAYLNHNINTDIGLANGTEIKYDSISFDDPDDERHYHMLMKGCSPGDTITLHKPPSAINVEIFADWPGDSEAQKKKNADKRRNWQHGSLVRSGRRIVIPISTSFRSYNEWEKTYVPPAYSTTRCESTGVVRRSPFPLYGVSTVPLRDHFCIEPGFCITLHKAQGRTIRRLVLSISDHPHPKLRQKWEGLYVGVSRVEYNEHFRLLLKRGDWGTATLLRDLERCKHTECFFKGYAQQSNHGGMRWNRQLARVAAEETYLFKKKKTCKAKKRSKRRWNRAAG